MKSRDEDHDKWLIKFNKSREGKMFNLVSDFEIDNAKYGLGGRPDYITHLCAALWIAVKGTRMEEDATKLMKEICPQFFNNIEQ